MVEKLMAKTKLTGIFERFANAYKLFTPTQQQPVHVYFKFDKWNVWYRGILLGRFEEKEEAIKFADIVAKTNNTSVKTYKV